MTKRKAANLANGANGNPMISAHDKGNESDRGSQKRGGAGREFDTLEVWPAVGLIRLCWYGPNEEPVHTAFFYSNPSNWVADTMRLAISEQVDGVIFTTPRDVEAFDDAITACAQCLWSLNITVCL